jgi:hypothetical protein
MKLRSEKVLQALKVTLFPTKYSSRLKKLIRINELVVPLSEFNVSMGTVPLFIRINELVVPSSEFNFGMGMVPRLLSPLPPALLPVNQWNHILENLLIF